MQIDFFFILTLFWDCIWLLRAGPLGLTPFLNIAQYLLYYTDVTLREECVEADIENNMANVYDTLSSPFTLKLWIKQEVVPQSPCLE